MQEKRKQTKHKHPYKYKILEHPMLGKVPDKTIAEELGCSTFVVGWHRRKHNIPTGKGKHFAGGRPRKYTDAITLHPLLGKVPDRVIAKELGCSGAAVAQVRMRLGLRKHYPETLIHEIPKTISSLKEVMKALQSIQKDHERARRLIEKKTKGEKRC